MTTYEVTVLGRDRPGIVAEATGLLADLGLNLEDSSMTLLRGRFAMTLICVGDAGFARVDTALDPLRADRALSVNVAEVVLDEAPGPPGTPWVLTVHGGDRPGIVSSVTGQVARAGGTITDLTTRLTGDLYLLIAEIELPAHTDPTALQSAVRGAAAELGVAATLRPADADEL